MGKDTTRPPVAREKSCENGPVTYVLPLVVLPKHASRKYAAWPSSGRAKFRKYELLCKSDDFAPFLPRAWALRRIEDAIRYLFWFFAMTIS